MNRIKFALAAVALVASTGVASAQSVRDVKELGASGDAVYSRQVQGSNGVVYNCRPDAVMVNGVKALACIRPGAAVAGLGGLGGGVAAGVGAVVLIALAVGDNSATTGT